MRDDGAVVYLNGTEMYRSNMPNGTVSYLTPASTSVGNADETTFFTSKFTITNLLTGTNIVAVEIHQNNATSSDMSFALELDGIGYVLPAPAGPPTLAIDRNDTQVFVRWPANASGYNLYSASSLGGTWNLVNGATGTTNNQKVLAISPGSPLSSIV